MGLVGFLKLALKCFDFLAWPLFALGCPLYASICAIETNSSSDMRNLVAYWIVFSLISLFELAFVKLIEWLPFWPYAKLMAICWLGLPHFNGAWHVYESLIRPYISLNPRGVIKHFVKQKEDLPLNAENFLAVAERYVEENGFEALEKLIDRKSKHTTPSIDMEDIKAVTNTEEKETAAAIQFGSTKFAPCLTSSPPDGRFLAPALVELEEKNPAAATQQPKFKKPNVPKENAKAGELKEENPASATEQVKCVEPNLAQTEKKTIADGEIKEKTVTAAARENKVGEVPVAAAHGENVEERPASEKVQKEWTCAVCQVTTTGEGDLNSHLHGTKHKAKCAELNASKQANKNKGCSSSTANQEPKKPVSGDWLNQNKSKKQEDKTDKVQVNQTSDQCKPKEVNYTGFGVTGSGDRLNQSKSKKQENKAQVNQTSDQCKQKKVKNTGYGVNQSKLWCIICNIKCPDENAMASHLRGKKHLSQVQQNTGYGVNQSKLWCIICNIKCPDENAMASHLQGKKHVSQVQQMLDSLACGHS